LAGFGGMGVLPSLDFVIAAMIVLPIGFRGEVIRRLTSGWACFGLGRFAPGLGKAS